MVYTRRSKNKLRFYAFVRISRSCKADIKTMITPKNSQPVITYSKGIWAAFLKQLNVLMLQLFFVLFLTHSQPRMYSNGNTLTRLPESVNYPETPRRRNI